MCERREQKMAGTARGGQPTFRGLLVESACDTWRNRDEPLVFTWRRSTRDVSGITALSLLHTLLINAGRVAKRIHSEKNSTLTMTLVRRRSSHTSVAWCWEALHAVRTYHHFFRSPSGMLPRNSGTPSCDRCAAEDFNGRRSVSPDEIPVWKLHESPKFSLRCAWFFCELRLRN